MRKLAKGREDYVCLFWSGRETSRNADSHFPFRATSDFLYLTGFSEPETMLLLIKKGSQLKTLIGVRPRDLSKNRGSEIWEGKRVGVEAAPKALGFDEAFDVHRSRDVIRAALDETSVLYWGFGEDTIWDENVVQLIGELNAHHRHGAVSIVAVKDPRMELQEMRKVKSPEEIKVMKESSDIASEAHIRAMESIRPGQHEYNIQAEVEAIFRKYGSHAPAYNTIAATGNNACTLHYSENRQKIGKSELFLLDAGAEYEGYASDITRTFPSNGKFTEAQAEVYSWVLRAQEAAIRAVKPGAAWNRPHQVAVRVISQGLKEMKILKGSVASIIKSARYREYFPHGTGHWIGMDVHDCGLYADAKGKPVRFRPGNVITIEPGLYFRSNDRSVPKKYRGIGVRIEDDVLVTRTGQEVLTASCPKKIREIEDLWAAHA